MTRGLWILLVLSLWGMGFPPAIAAQSPEWEDLSVSQGLHIDIGKHDSCLV